MAKGQPKRGKLRMMIKKMEYVRHKGRSFFFLRKFSTSKLHQLRYTQMAFLKFSVRRAVRARSCIFEAGDEERLHIFVLRLAGCWLSGHCRFLAGGGRQDRQSPGGGLLE